MSFGFGDINPPMKAQAAYKDGGGMGGGGMYFQQKNKKRKDQPDEDIFHKAEEKDDLTFGIELTEDNIPKDSLFNKFVNWFNINKK